MITLRGFFILCGVTFGLSACSVDQGSDSSSTVRLKLPESFSTQNKAQSKADVTALGGVACFAISIRASDIDETAGDSCNPKYGQFVGLVAGGDEIELEVQRGNGRILDLYYIGLDACSEVDPQVGLGEWGANNVHRLAHMEDIKLDKAESQIKVQIELPSASNTLEVVHSFPTSCRVGNDNLLAASKQVRQVVGAISGTFPSGNAGIALRIAPSTIEVSENSSNTVRLKPHRLGVKE